MTKNVKLVKELHLTVSLVTLIEANTQTVCVYKDFMKIKKYVKNVLTNVLHVFLHKAVQFVKILHTELDLNVNVLQDGMMLVNHHVVHVQFNVGVVQIKKINVMTVPLEDLKTHLLVLVQKDRLTSKDIVMHVVTDVQLAQQLLTIVINVQEIELQHQIVHVKMDLGMMEFMLNVNLAQ